MPHGLKRRRRTLRRPFPGWRALSAGLWSGALACKGWAGWAPCELHRCELDGRQPRRPYLASAAVGRPTSASGLGLSEAEAWVQVLRHGTIDCFEAGALRDASEAPGEPASCEGSAVVFDGERLLVASDKQIPGARRSSLFEVPFAPSGAPAGPGGPDGSSPRLGRNATRYLEAAPYAGARKLEDASLDPGEGRVFLSTGFDRVKPGGDAWDGYNVLLTYPAGAPEAPQVIGVDDREVETSVELRDLLGAQLPTRDHPGGAPYFKVEGIAAAPGRRLLFGIRELGTTYQAFEYAVIIVEARWRETDAGRIVLDPASFRTVYRIDDLWIEGHRVGLSSLEYDPQHDRYLLLVSYEHEGLDAPSGEAEGALGGFLLTLGAEALSSGALPSPVIGPSGRPIHFLNKPEGLTRLGPDHWLVLFDDDRILERGHEGHVHRRAPHQTAVGLLHLAAVGRTPTHRMAGGPNGRSSPARAGGLGLPKPSGDAHASPLGNAAMGAQSR